jgi:hypothetical protein
MTKDMTLYDGVKYVQILEAVYKQGKKDGASEAFGALQKQFRVAQAAIPGLAAVTARVVVIPTGFERLS